jgi:hypothetical protein
MTKIEAQIEAARQTIFSSKPGSAEAIRAGYDLVTLRHKQANPDRYSF